MKAHDSDFAMYPKSGGGMGFETKKDTCEGVEYVDVFGFVETPQGIVRAWSLSWKQKSSTLYMIVNGRNYIRKFTGKAYTQRGLVMKAKQFAIEIEVSTTNRS